MSLRYTWGYLINLLCLTYFDIYQKKKDCKTVNIMHPSAARHSRVLVSSGMSSTTRIIWYRSNGALQFWRHFLRSWGLHLQLWPTGGLNAEQAAEGCLRRLGQESYPNFYWHLLKIFSTFCLHVQINLSQDQLCTGTYLGVRERENMFINKAHAELSLKKTTTVYFAVTILAGPVI